MELIYPLCKCSLPPLTSIRGDLQNILRNHLLVWLCVFFSRIALNGKRRSGFRTINARNIPHALNDVMSASLLFHSEEPYFFPFVRLAVTMFGIALILLSSLGDSSIISLLSLFSDYGESERVAPQLLLQDGLE